MNKTIIKRVANLLNVKSLVTLVLTAVFAVMALWGTISQDFMTIYAVIIAFYFGTQSQKVQDVAADSATDGSGIRAELNHAQALREAPQGSAFSAKPAGDRPTDAPAARSMEDGDGNS